MFLSPLRKLLAEPLPKIPLRWVLVVPFVLQIVGAVSLVGYLSYRSGQTSVRILADRLVSEADGRVRDHLDSYLRETFRAIEINDRAVKQGRLDIENRAALQDYLWQQIELSTGLTATQFFNARGEEITYLRLNNRALLEQARRLTGENLSPDTLIYAEAESAEPEIRKYYLVNERGEPRRLLYTFKIDNRMTPWFQYGGKMDRLGWSPVYLFRIVPSLALAGIAPVRDARGTFQGLFISSFQLSDIGAYLQTLDFSPSGQVFIVDRTGNLIATSSGETPFITPKNGHARQLAAIDSRDETTRSIARQLLDRYGGFPKIPDGKILDLFVNGQRHFTSVNSYRDKNGLDWIRIVTIPESDFMEAIEENNRRTIVLCGLTLLVATGLGLLTARAIAKPILDLNRASQNLERGEWGQQPRREIAIDELETLTRSFESMAAKLQESLDRTKSALDESEDKFAKIFRASPDAIAIVSLETGAYIAVNDRFAVQTGYSREEAIGCTARDLGLLAHPDRECEIQRQLQLNGSFRDIEIQWRARSGEIRIGSVSGESIELDGHPCLLSVFRDYTDRQRAESILREAERVAHIGSWEFDLATGTVFWSEQLYRIHGLDPLGIPPSPEAMVSRIIHPDDRDIYEDFAERLDRGETVERDLRVVRADGSLRYITATGEAILDSNGKPIRFVGTVLDITQRKQVELELSRSRDELQEKENRFQALATALPGVLYTVVEGLNGPRRFEYVNPTFEEIHEIPIADVLVDATPVFDAIHPEDRAGYLQAVVESLDNLKPFRYEWRIIVPSGKIKWLQANSQPERRENGEIVWHGFVQDITDRKYLELALQASEARLNDIQSNVNVILSSFRVFRDGGWAIDHVSPTSERITGFTAEELTVDPNLWTSRIDPEDWNAMLPNVFDNIFACRPATYEYRFHCKDGSQLWISQISSPRYDAENDCWIVTNVSSDISERHAIERMKDEFISVVSHELRTPLTAIRGAIGLLAAGVLDSQADTAREMLAIASRNCDRLGSLVDDILDLERLKSGNMELEKEPCSVGEIIEKSLDSVAMLAKNAGITLESVPLNATVNVDRAAIEQTLVNLIGNAIKFSPAGSTIRVRARAIDPEPDTDFPTPRILLSVEDRGRGIPADKLESIFGRFQQVDISDARQKGGAGLGLAICQNIVTRHGGKIWAESVLGEGSTFYFTLPLPERESRDL
ncbi:PAS domain-containing protein [Pannus brasiliensis CCIBt3594]|uniref:histidine kinase n=1 Tax=Pannus brasiliensis CCIBt3594 TaxID=1427578 RepID=A0AAW9QLW0_9CHRO